MSMQAMLRSHPLGEDTAGRRPTIIPTRRRLDRRFPSLGFTVTTSLPWVEVLIATNPGLFDPSHSESRTAATFYASRSNGGLTPTATARARYVVPATVVERLASAGASLWYLAVGYPDATGVGGIASAETGASGDVLIDPSLRSRNSSLTTRRSLALTRALGEGASAPVDRMAGEDIVDLQQAIPSMQVRSSLSQGRNRTLDSDDLRQGEDGEDLPQSRLPATPQQPIPAPMYLPVPANSAAGRPPDAEPVPIGTVPGSASVAVGPNGAARPNSSQPAPSTTSSDFGAAIALAEYDDGWDSMDMAGVPALSAIPALSDEYPDIDWSGVDVQDRYGQVPDYQSLEDLTQPDVVAPVSGAPGAPEPVTLPALDLTSEVRRRIVELTAGGDGAAYSSVNADGPFRGRHGPGHKAYQRFHTGLSFGIAEFNQDVGTLGQLLRLMQAREPETFVAVFGDAADAMIATATAPGPSSEHVEGGRGPRVQPVANADLWDEPWLSRFRAAGAVPAFRAAQNQLAAELYLAPMLTVAAGFGLTSERALCMVLDRAIALGEQGGKRWIADTVGPVRTHALRHEALAALGFDSIEAFQASVPGLLNDGEFGPVSHATLTAALRGLGAASPLPLSDTRQAIEDMARRGQGEDGAARLVRLAAAPELSDNPIGG